jgi:hypothetical protein
MSGGLHEKLCMWICNVLLGDIIGNNNHKKLMLWCSSQNIWKILNCTSKDTGSHPIKFASSTTLLQGPNVWSLTQSICLGWLIKLSYFKIWLKSVPLRIEVSAKISKRAVMWNPPSHVSKQACEGERSCIWRSLYVDGGHAHTIFCW